MPIINLVRHRPRIRANQIAFTESQIWTVPRGVKKIDVFLVGGGGGSGGSHCYVYFGQGQEYTGVFYDGGSGGCGYTATHKNIAVTPGQQFKISIGAGGARGLIFFISGSYDRQPLSIGDVPSASQVTSGGDGGTTTFGSFSATGGKGGKYYNYNGGQNAPGGNGGSGGGAGGRFHLNRSYGGQDTYYYDDYSGPMGYDGGNGGDSENGIKGGTGQGTTTRAFAEVGGTLYSSRDALSAHGKGGISGSYGSSGSQGIVLVRWQQQ